MQLSTPPCKPGATFTHDLANGVPEELGKLKLRVPGDRGDEFSTVLFERYARSEKALAAVLAEMYVQGVSTR